LHSLFSFAQSVNELKIEYLFEVLIYDNSLKKTSLPDTISIPFTYVHDPSNNGLVGAYNLALKKSINCRSDWLLLLDQDTTLNSEYLESICAIIYQNKKDLNCAAIVPKLKEKNRIISPVRVMRWGRLVPVDKQFCGVAPWEVSALNSTSLLRISAIRTIGGFHPEFWLDYQDHWIFNRLSFYDFKIFVLDIVLEHQLSVKSMECLSPTRYENILRAEQRFYELTKSPIENLIYNLRLIARMFQLFLQNQRKLLSLTVKHLKNNLLKSIKILFI